MCKFLDDMQAAVPEPLPALGEGEDLRIESDAVAGGALYADARVVHLCSLAAALLRRKSPFAPSREKGRG